MPNRGWHRIEHHLHLSTQQIGQCGRRSEIRHQAQVDAGHHLEQLDADVLWSSVTTTNGHLQLPWIGLRVCQELGNRPHWHRRIYLHDEGYARNACDRCDVAREIEIQMFEKRRVDRVDRTAQKECVPIGRRFHHFPGSDIAALTRMVFDNELLTEPFRQPWTNDTRGNVHGSTLREPHEDPHRPHWISLRPRDRRDERHRDRTCSELQESSTSETHGALPCLHRTTAKSYLGSAVAGVARPAIFSHTIENAKLIYF